LQGTAPFIAIELLIYAAEHRVVHDLESLFYVLLFICTHLQGTNGQLADPPLYGNTKEHGNLSALASWLKMDDLPTLGHLKFSHMVGHFESHVLPYISPYFHPLTNHLAAFWKALIPVGMSSQGSREAVRSASTCQDIIQVIQTALLDQTLIEEARKVSCDSVLGKRSCPGELVVAKNGWDAVKLPKTRMKPAKTSSKAPRQTKLISKIGSKNK
jgi:hypothetical protein